DYRRFAADQSQHDTLIADKAEWFEVSGAWRIVFEQKVIGVGSGEELLRNPIVPAGREIMSLEVAATHVHADHSARRSRGNRVIESLDVEPDELLGILPGPFHHFTDGRIAQQRNGHLVELDVLTSGVREFDDLGPIYSGKIVKKCV